MTALTEADVEHAALAWLESVGWQTAHGPDLIPNERADYGSVILETRLRDAICRLNPELPADAWDDAFNKLTRPAGSNLVARNREFHRMLVNGVTVEFRVDGGSIRGAQARVIDFDDVSANDFLAVNQVTVTENQNTRRADIVLFVNGLPLGVIELKNPADPDADIWDAWNQLQTYKDELPTLFAMNELLMISDGAHARVGTLTAGREWFKPWRTTTGDSLAETSTPELQVMLEGVCSPDRLAALLRDYVVFEDDGGGSPVKKMAGYHQFHAVQVAVQETLRAAELQQSDGEVAGEQSGSESGQHSGGKSGDRRIGVVWHTQGSGKSLSMAFYAGSIARHPAMENPTVVVLTDRNDLDDQLFGTFARCQDLLRQEPTQAETRTDLRRKLSVQSGGVVFTTIQKFFPEERGDTYRVLSERRNIVVIADEAHRSQYDFIDGFARHIRDGLPNASFIGFTGTPIESDDVNTRAVFGEYISVYDIRNSVADGATVPIYYESRLARLTLEESARPSIDADFEEVTEGEEIESKEKLKTRWAQQEALVGAEPRLKQVAQDIVSHFEQRLEVLDGKAMIVCMSRRICVELYEELVRLRPHWHGDEDGMGRVKVVMTGAASDPSDWQQHIRNKSRRETLANRFRDPEDPFQVVIVRDMWLTGFDAPNLHTMYVDKRMRGHGLMQTIARVNRVFKDKPGGLIVDYLGIAQELKQAVATYTESRGTGDITIDQDEAVAVMQEKYEVCCCLFHGFDYSAWADGTPVQRLSLLTAALDHILAPDKDKGKERCLQAVRELAQAFALSVPHPAALGIRNDVAFFQAIRAQLGKRAPGEARNDEDLDSAIRQIVSGAVASEGVLDIFAAADLDKPDISVLSDDFLDEIQRMPQRNLAVEALQRLLKGELATRYKKNVVQSRSFAKLLEQTLIRYRNRAIEAAQVIEALIDLAHEMREASARGERLGLSDDELAFYDALATNDSAVQVLGDDHLKVIARELVQTVRNNVGIDWTLRESARANLRRMVRRTLNRHGYPPDQQERAIRTVIEQAELFPEDLLQKPNGG